MPPLPPELVRTERLQPLASPASGELVSIDKASLEELYARLAEAAGAIGRSNLRVGGVKQLWRCVDEIFRTGIAPPACSLPPPR